MGGSASVSGHNEWEYLGGGDIEPYLHSGAIALLDARWVVALAQEEGSTISQRQHLPQHAFLPLEALAEAGVGTGGGLRIVGLSAPWLHPEHPDPRGATLQLVSRVLEAFLEVERKKQKPEVWGLFWDVASLHQPPD